MPRPSTLWKALRSGQIWLAAPHAFFSRRNARLIDATAPMPSASFGNADAIEAVMMTGESQHYDLLFAAKSLVRWYPEPIVLTIYADQSLTAATEEKIQRHLPNAKIWRRIERDAIVEPELRRRALNQCLRFREQNVFAAKIVDNAILGQSKYQLLHDSDVLSFGPLTHLQTLTRKQKPVMAFGRDPVTEPYALPAEDLSRLLNVEIRPHMNAGLCLVPRSIIDLAQIDRWLSTPNYPATSHFGEQMLWPALADRAMTRGEADFEYLPSADYNIGRTLPNAETSCRLIHYCGHYLSTTRIAMRRRGQPRVIQDLATDHR